MAYVEVYKSGTLITRHRVDEQKARRGCRIRLGSAGEVHLAIGQTQNVGKYDACMCSGEPPDTHGPVKEDVSKPKGKVEAPLPLDFSVGAPSSGADEPGLPPDIEGYKIIECIGKGGMGTVWRAEQLSTHREVALKLMASAQFDSAKARARFEREVELTARLDHPNIARVYDSGLHHGIYYYAMEFVDGMPLDTYVEKKALSEKQILVLMHSVCEAIEHAHLRGVMHRDLKPSNIMVGFDGQPHVVDFGLARTFLDEPETVTVSIEGEVAGTPAYMSPEQAAGHRDQIDTRTDVYSLGVILYRLLTGRSPYDLSGSLFDVLQRVVQGKIRRPREVTKSVDRELETLLLKALSQEPDGRYASAGMLADDIDNYLNQEPLYAQVPTTLYFLRKKARKYRMQVGLGLAVLIVLFSVVLIAYTKVVGERTRRQIAEQDTERNKIKLKLKSQELTLAELEVIALGSDKKLAEAALDLIVEAYITAHDEISQLNYRLGERKPPVSVRRIDLNPGSPLGPNALVRRPSLPQGITSWTVETRAHRSIVTKLVFSPDGSLLASAGKDGTIRVWGSESGRLVHVLVDPNAHVTDLAWSMDGKYLHVTSAIDPDRQLAWNIEPDRVQAVGSTLTGLTWHDASGVCWSAGSSAPAQTVDEVTGLLGIELPSAWSSIGRPITALAFSPGRHELACGDEDGTIRLFDAVSGKVRYTCPAAWCGPIHSLGFAPNGQTLATYAGPGTMCLWDAHRWEPLHKFAADSITGDVTSIIGAITWAPDSTHIARTNNQQKAVEITDWQSGDVLRALSGHGDNITTVSWSSNGRFVAAGTVGGTIHVWDSESDSDVPSVTLSAHTGAVSALEWTPESQTLITAGRDGKIKIWASQNGTLTNTLERQTSPVTCAALSRDGNVLASVSADGRIRLWHAQDNWTSTLIRIDPNDTEAGQYSLNTVAWSPDSTYLALGDSLGKIRIWNQNVNQWQHSLVANCASISSLTWSPDGRVLLCGGMDGTVRAWDAKNDLREHVVLLPLGDPTHPGMAVSTTGDYRGAPGLAKHLVYAIQTQTTDARLTISPADFKSQYGWVNESWQVGLYESGAELIERIHVNAASEGPYDGQSWATAFGDLQEALSIAQPNTEIWVAEGVYTPDRGTRAREASFRLKDGVRLFGGFAGTETTIHQRDPNENETVLSGDLTGNDGPDFVNNDENSYHVVTSSSTNNGVVVLNGFTIIGGNANGSWESRHNLGGGIRNASPDLTIVNCIFRYNSADGVGGALSNSRYRRIRGATLIDYRFIRNHAVEGGGAISNGGFKATLSNCTFISNSSWKGGAISNVDRSEMVVTNSEFMSNSAGLGGGIDNYLQSILTLVNCRFGGNSAEETGGGICNGESRLTATNCMFIGNRSERGGGGLYTWPSEKVQVHTTLTNCTIVANASLGKTGGILSSPGCSISLTNCILWGNTEPSDVTESAQIQGGATIINKCCIQGWSDKLGGTGNFSDDPLFVDPNGPDARVGTEDDNLRLKIGSPCINTGDNAAIPIDTLDLDNDGDPNEPIPFDLDGKPRVRDRTVDIGAYESG